MMKFFLVILFSFNVYAGLNTDSVSYSTGTWTPTISGSGTAGAGTYTTRLGTYTKIGRAVLAHWYTVTTAHTGTGNITLSGLPFTSEASTVAACSILVSDLAMTAANYAQAQVTNSQTTVSITQTPTGGGATAAIPLDTAFTLSMTCAYTATN